MDDNNMNENDGRFTGAEPNQSQQSSGQVYGEPSQSYQQENQPYRYEQQGGYEQELEEPVSMGDWLIALLLMLIPCVNIILMFVWAFSDKEKKSKSNFFKAQLIMTGILIVLYLILIFSFGAYFVALMSNYAYW